MRGSGLGSRRRPPPSRGPGSPRHRDPPSSHPSSSASTPARTRGPPRLPDPPPPHPRLAFASPGLAPFPGGGPVAEGRTRAHGDRAGSARARARRSGSGLCCGNAEPRPPALAANAGPEQPRTPPEVAGRAQQPAPPPRTRQPHLGARGQRQRPVAAAETARSTHLRLPAESCARPPVTVQVLGGPRLREAREDHEAKQEEAEGVPAQVRPAAGRAARGAGRGGRWVGGAGAEGQVSARGARQATRDRLASLPTCAATRGAPRSSRGESQR